MSTLIDRARAERARIDAEIAAEERVKRDQEEDREIAQAREALAGLFDIHPENMTDVRGPWAGVTVSPEGLRFTGRVSGSYGHVRLIAPCPDCGELYCSEKIGGLYNLAETLEQLESGARGYRGRPLWMGDGHECPARAARFDAPAQVSGTPSTAELLEGLIRQIVAEELEARLPA